MGKELEEVQSWIKLFSTIPLINIYFQHSFGFGFCSFFSGYKR